MSQSTTSSSTEKPGIFVGHHTSINAVCYSPDGKQIATGGRDPPARIWDANTGEVLFEPKIQQRAFFQYVESVCYSPDGKRLVGLDDDGIVYMWDMSDGKLVVKVESGHYRDKAITYSPDGYYIATCGHDNKARLWRTRDLPEVIKIQHAEGVTCVNFSPDGHCLATGSKDKRIRIFDVETGTRVVRRMEGHTKSILAVIYSPNGEQLASCADDGTIRTWDVSTGTALLGPLKGHTEGVTCVVYSPDGRQLVSCSKDQFIRVWDSQTGKLVGGPVRGHDREVRAVSFSPDGSRFVTGADGGSMRVWDARTQRIILPELTEDEKDRYRLSGPFRGHFAAVTTVSCCPDGDRIASISKDGTIRLWDVRTGEEVLRFASHSGKIASISSDGGRLVSGSADTLTVWDTRTGDAVLGPLKGDDLELICVKFSPDDKRIASVDFIGDLRAWDSETGEELWSIEGRARTISFAPDGSRLASCGRKNSIVVWDMSTSELIAGPFEAHSSIVASIAFSPDGLSIVSGSWDHTVYIWDSKTGAIILGPLRHSHRVTSVSYSPDGTRICSASSDGTICLWHASTGDLIVGPLQGHHDTINSTAFSPDGKCFVTGSDDWTIKLWDATTGEIIRFPDTSEDVPLQDTNADQFGSSVLDLPITQLGKAPDTQPIQEIGLGSIVDLPARTCPEDFQHAATDPVRDDSRVRERLFSFSRIRHAVTNMFQDAQPEPDAVELQQRRHRRASIRTAYTRMKSFVVIASKKRPREQALRDASDDGTGSDGGESARQGARNDEDMAHAQPANVADISGTRPAEAVTGGVARHDDQHNPPSMQRTTPYVAPTSSEGPRITFAGGTSDSEDSFEADCCPCCAK